MRVWRSISENHVFGDRSPDPHFSRKRSISRKTQDRSLPVFGGSGDRSPKLDVSKKSVFLMFSLFCDLTCVMVLCTRACSIINTMHAPKRVEHCNRTCNETACAGIKYRPCRRAKLHCRSVAWGRREGGEEGKAALQKCGRGREGGVQGVR